MKPLRYDLAIKLRSAREQSGLSQTEVAKRMRLTRNTLVNWESARTEPTVTEFVVLAALYDVAPESLLPRSGVII